ncbi:Alcohol acetyltransferase [uncultured archaeon]|nr:Alcohol acetyltransferase [uncultured archaeon]
MNQSERKDRGISIPGCLRRLSNFERYLLWSAENNMAAVVRILGDVGKDDLRRAIDSVGAVHPLTVARVVIDGHHDIWFSTDHAQKATLRTVQRTSDERWFEETRQEYLLPFEPERGPLIRFVLVYSRPVSELIVFSQHSICDGLSLVNLLHDILIRYANPAVGGQALCPPVTCDYLEKGDMFSSKSIDKAAIDHYNEQWQKSPHYFSQKDFIIIYKALARRIRHRIVILQLEPEETLDLAARCRENGATVTSAMTAAFLAAYQEIRGQLPENRRTIQVPFDLRRRLGPNRENFLGFFVGAFKFPFAYNSKESFWKNARELQEIIRKRAEILDTSAINMEPFDPTLVDAFTNCAPYVDLLPEAFSQTENLSAFARDRENIAFELSSKAVYNLPGTISTSIGRLNFPQLYGTLRIDRIFFVAPGSEAFPLFIAGVSIDDRLAFSLNYVEPVEGGCALTRDMIRIRNKALEYLGFPEKASDRAI